MGEQNTMKSRLMLSSAHALIGKFSEKLLMY